MKNLLLTIAAAALLLLTSCQRDELQGGSISGEEVTVSISAVMPGDGGTVVKSDTEPGDGSLANRCIMQIYYLPDVESGSADPIPYGDRVTVAVSGMKALFPDQRLVSGHDYRFVFWADHVTDNSSAEALAQDLHYDTEEFPIVSFKEEEDGTLSYSSNDDNRDAFFAAEVRNISGPSSLSFDLKRPFGQLNIITTDWGAIPDGVVKQLRPSYVKLEFSSLPNSIDLVSGDVTGRVNISSEVAPVSQVPLNGDSKQLSFDYIFAKDGEQTVLEDFTMDFLLEDRTTQVTDEAYTFTSIPVQRNYQTNVSGNLLTDRTGIEVEVVSDFDGEYNMDVPDVKEVTLDENTRLSQIMTEEELLQYTSLKVNGIMKEEDFEFISPAVHVFSLPDEPAPEEYHLEMLDLSGADIQIMYPIGDEGRSSRNPNNVLTKVILPEGLESIMGNTFAHCRALSEINLPSTLKTLSVGVFYYAYALTELELPDGLQSIGDACFLRSGITSVRTGTALTKLGGPSAGGVFQACEDLVSVDLSASTGLSEIMQRTFYNCSALNNVLLPNSIRAISSDAFYGCTSLKQLTLPASVESIREDSFDRISGLTLTVEAVTPPVIDGGNLPVAVFEKILVPQNSVQTYKTAVGWTDVAEKISAID